MTIPNNNRLKNITLLIAAILPLLGAFGYIILLPPSSLTSIFYSLSKLAMVLIGLFGWFILKIKPPQAFRLTRNYITTGLITGIIGSLAILIIFILLKEQIVPYSATIRTEIGSLVPLSLFIPAAITFSVIHSLLEEIYWRGFVGIGTGSLLLTAAAFSAHHFVVLGSVLPFSLSLIGTIGVAVGGYFWGLLTQKTGGLVASWISHALIDITLFAVIYSLI